MTAARAIVQILRRRGIRHVFGVPGESYLALLDALHDEPSITYITTRHEEGAVFAAEAYAKATGTVGVVMATRAVGAANLAIGIHTARQDSTPLVALIGQVPTRFRHREAFQEVDLAAAFAPMAKWAVEVQQEERVPELVERAFRVALTGRPGPVVVVLPENVLEAEVPDALPQPMNVPRPRPAREEVEAAARLLVSARFPVVIAGGGVLRAEATAHLTQLAERLAIPVMTAFRRFDVFPNHHPLFLGRLGLGLRKELLQPLLEADLILVLGSRLSEVTTQGYSLPPRHAQVIQVDVDPSVLGAVCDVDLPILADVEQFLRDLLDAVEGYTGGATSATVAEREQRIRAYKEAHDRLTTPRPLRDSEPVDPEGIIHDLLDLLPPDTPITTDAGNFSGWLTRYYSFRQTGTHYGPTSGAMGYGLPAAIGVGLALPDRRVVCLAGDGGFMMTMAELATALHYKVPVISLVFNNRMYGTIRMHQERRYPGRVVGTDLADPHFAAIASGMGCLGIRVESNREFQNALRVAQKTDKPAVIELMVNPECLSANQR